MIDAIMFRCRVGLNHAKYRRSKIKKDKFNLKPQVMYNVCGLNILPSYMLLYYIFMLYIYMFIIATVQQDSSFSTINSFLILSNNYLPYSYIKLNFIVLISYLIRRFMYYRRSNMPLSHILTLVSSKKKFCKVLGYAVVWVFLLNFLLIVVVNPSLLNPGPNNFTVLYHNVQGLIPFSDLGQPHPKLNQNKLFELQAHVYENKPAVIVLNETWLKSSISDNEIFPDNCYKVFRNDRSQWSHPRDPTNPNKFRKYGGGVLIAVRSNLDVVSKKIKLSSGTEMIAVELTFPNGEKTVICTCYRVGTLGEPNHDKVISNLRSMLNKRKPPKLHVIGDFNLPNISWENYTSSVSLEQLFLDSFSDLGLKQCIDNPTHIKGRILDILLSNADSFISDVSVLDKFSVCKSNHFPVQFLVKTSINLKKAIKRKCYNFKKARWDDLNSELRRTDWQVLNNCEVEHGWNFFKTRLFELVNKYIPKVTVKSDSQPPWFDSDAFSAWRTKERLRAKFNHTKNKIDELKYSNSRRVFRQVVAQKMRDNMVDSDDDALITKKFWSYVKSTSKSSRIPECVNYEDQLRYNPRDQAELYNEFFFKQFSEPSSYNINIDIDPANESNFNIDFDHTYIRKLLQQVNSNKAQGPDGIHGKLLKQCAVGLSYPLSLLFKISYNTGCLPNEWKMANVVPVHKKGSKSNVENYRPISLTCLVMKIFERIVRQKVLDLTSQYLDPRQHGFLANKSCTTNMVGFCDVLALSLDAVIRTDVIYFDFSKAFDSVKHDLILWKLKYLYDIDGTLLRFIKNYLQGRSQRVVIGNSSSSDKPVLSGVPQGSIIGPLLFVLFINDISIGLSPGTNLALYADDTKISREIRCENDHDILQKDIDYLNDWAMKNNMNFHPKKCKVLSVATSPPPLLDILPCIQYIYCLGNNQLDYVASEKDLGVIVTPKCDWTEQCNNLYSKANQQLGMVKRTAFFVNDFQKRRALYISLVRSIFEHCSIIWHPSGATLTNKIESIQKRALKWIFREEAESYSSQLKYFSKCRQANLLPLSIKFELNDLLFLHKIIHKLVPVELPGYLSFFVGQTRLRSSHLDHMSIVSSVTPRCPTNVFARSFFYRTHCKWNRLSLEIRELECHQLFKTELIKSLWADLVPETADTPDPFDVLVLDTG